MKVELQKEHEWLQMLVGDWTSEMEASMGPGQPTQTFRGTETGRSLGGAWVMLEGRGDMPGGGVAVNVMTLGYDPAKQRFVGTFISSVMTHLWVYEGQLDAAGKLLTLDTVGPDFSAPGKMTKYKDMIELKSDDHRVLSSSMQGDDGQWHSFMTANYFRRK